MSRRHRNKRSVPNDDKPDEYFELSEPFQDAVDNLGEYYIDELDFDVDAGIRKRVEMAEELQKRHKPLKGVFVSFCSMFCLR
jgi:hypothetical protein